MRNYAMSAVLLALGACASTDAPVAPVAAAAAATPASGASSVAQQTCHRETKLGSNFPQTVCESTSDADRRAQMDDLRRQQNNQLSRGQ